MSAAVQHRPGLRAHARRRRLPARRARAGADRRRRSPTPPGGCAGRCCPAGRGAPARVAEAVLATRGADLLAELLGTFAAFEAWTMIVGCGGDRARRLHVDRRSPLAARGRAPPPAARAVAARGLARRRRGRRGRRGVDGADPRQPRRGHGPRRHALVPHAARDPVRARRRTSARSTTSTRSSSPRSTRRTPRSCTRSRCSPSTATSSRRCSTSAGSALGLTAAYCIGRPYGLGPQSLIGGAIALGAQNLVEFQAGRGAQRHRRASRCVLARRRDPRERRGGAPRAAESPHSRRVRG